MAPYYIFCKYFQTYSINEHQRILAHEIIGRRPTEGNYVDDTVQA
jgi:hypothetical protein